MTNTAGAITESIEEMINTAQSIHGTAVVNAAQGMFELVQITHAMAVIERAAGKKGADVSALTAAARALLANVTARLVEPLTETGGVEARALAERLEARRSIFEQQRKAKQP